jgi:methyl-accepting chemotaxis protein
MLLANMKLGQKLAVVVALPLLLSACLGIWLWYVMGHIDASVEIVKEQNAQTILAKDMEKDVIQVQQYISDISATRAQDGLNDGLEMAKKYHDSFIKKADIFQQSFTAQSDHKGVNTIKDLKVNFGIYYETGEKMAQAYIEGGPSSGNKLMSDFDHASDLLQNTLKPFVQEQLDDSIAALGETGRSASRVRMVATIFNIGAIVISIVLAIVLIRSVLHQLGGDPKDVARVVNTMASGDFSQQPDKSPSAGSLLANAYHMQLSLRSMIARVKNQSNQVGDMAHSLATSAQQIAKNVNHESEAVNGMAAAIEELSVSTTHISDQGDSAKRISNNSRDNAEQGAQVVNKTVAGLLAAAQEIETASAEVSLLGQDASNISDVVKVIKEIADQTNLLALNAAIEAARAGEQGRGFAVVADEVRKLAERTANATIEISQMSSKIGDVATRALSGMDKVVSTTRQGVSDAETAQNSIALIQQSFGEVAKTIDEIAGSLTEQTVVATELAKSTERISFMSEENSGAAQNLLSLANDLEGKAREVRHAVEVFRV